MASRSSRLRLRSKITALLVSLFLLWAFAAWVTLRDGVNLLWVQTYNSRIYDPSESLLLELQTERRMSVVQLGTAGAGRSTDVDAQRSKVDGLAAEFRRSAQDRWARWAADADLERRVADVLTGLDGLGAMRASIDARSVDRAAAATTYTEVIESIFQVYYSLGKLDDQAIADDTVTLIQLNEVREIVSQEDALLAGALAANRFTDLEYARFTQLVGAQRFLAGTVAGKLPAADRAHYDAMTGSAEFTRFRTIEDQVVGGSRTTLKVPVDAAGWQVAAEAAQAQILDVVLKGGDAVVGRATPVAAWVIIRLLLAAGLGFAALVASIVISITTARRLLEQLVRLRDAAHELANERLPAVMQRLRSGEQVDVATEVPPLAFGDDEVGQVGQAFNAVQEAAVRAAVEQAELRRSVREVFVSIARRSQSLIHRQLQMLDQLERKEQDATRLDELFKVDHLATRMRRNAENLILLGGGAPGRVWRRPVPMIDVIRGATAEIEEYTRVEVRPIPQCAVEGRAVGDIIHLLAELVENAAGFSPPQTMVTVAGQLVSNGFVVEIEDRGLGMGEQALASANQQVTEPPEFQLSSNVVLGLFVVGRLAQKHGIRVQLRPSPFGGTTAIVLIPAALIVVDEQHAGLPARLAAANGAAAITASSAAGADAAVARSTQPVIFDAGPAAEPRHGAVAVISRQDEFVGQHRTGPNGLTADASADAAGASSGASSGALSGPAAEPSLAITASGLDRRERRPRRLQGEAVPPPPPAGPPDRSAEEVGARMAALQAGSRRAWDEGAVADGPTGEASPEDRRRPGSPAEQ